MPADVLASKLFQVSGARKRAASHQFITSLFLDHSQTQAYAAQDSRVLACTHRVPGRCYDVCAKFGMGPMKKNFHTLPRIAAYQPSTTHSTQQDQYHQLPGTGYQLSSVAQNCWGN